GVVEKPVSSSEASVNVHKNAKLTPAGRALLVERVVGQGVRQVAVAAAFGVSGRTVAKWVRRWRVEGASGLVDRSSRPRRCPHRLRRAAVRRIERLRRRRWTSPGIAQALGLPVSTVVLTLAALGAESAAGPRAARPRGALRAGGTRGTGARRHQAARTDCRDWPSDPRRSPAPSRGGSGVGDAACVRG